MIPPFDDVGFLPPGVHRATLDEVRHRFGTGSEARQSQMESVIWMIDLAICAGVQRIILNGSFVTDIIEPNDVDCVLLVAPAAIADKEAMNELEDIIPYLDISLVDQNGFDQFVNRFFAFDRRRQPKGMIEVII